MTSCVLCQETGGEIIYQDAFARLVDPGETAYPGFVRLILQQHVREMTDLSLQERTLLMGYVYAIEQVQRSVLKAEKINLAQFGTMVPHIHWHIIPRFSWDLHYPNSFWSAPAHDGQAPEYLAKLAEQESLIQTYHERLRQTLRGQVLSALNLRPGVNPADESL